MVALIVIDVQNEFTEKGERPVVDISNALEAIELRVKQARHKDKPIAWIRHFNKPTRHQLLYRAPGALNLFQVLDLSKDLTRK